MVSCKRGLYAGKRKKELPIFDFELAIENRKLHVSASHVEQAQPRESVFLQQTFVHVLLLQLLDLC